MVVYKLHDNFFKKKKFKDYTSSFRPKLPNPNPHLMTHFHHLFFRLTHFQEQNQIPRFKVYSLTLSRLTPPSLISSTHNQCSVTVILRPHSSSFIPVIPPMAVQAEKIATLQKKLSIAAWFLRQQKS